MHCYNLNGVNEAMAVYVKRKHEFAWVCLFVLDFNKDSGRSSWYHYIMQAGFRGLGTLFTSSGEQSTVWCSEEIC